MFIFANKTCSCRPTEIEVLNSWGMYNKASILNRKMAMSLLLLLLIINMKTIAIISIVGIALLMKLELCWSQFQLQGPTFHPLHHTFFRQSKWKLQDPPQTPLHFNFQYLIVIIIGGEKKVSSDQSVYRKLLSKEDASSFIVPRYVELTVEKIWEKVKEVLSFMV